MDLPGEAMGSPFDGHSPAARAIAQLFTQTLIVCGIVLAIVTGLVAYCIVKFRAKDGAKEPVQTHGHTRLEIAWTMAPFLIVLGLFFLTARTMAAADPPEGRAPDLTVIAHQWWWEARYPSLAPGQAGVVTANEIHLPVSKQVLVELQSADVIHDFWVPTLARKIDAIPGRPNHFWISADAPGTYDGTCAEYCGAEHAWMRIRVVVQTETDFDAWQKHERSPALPVPGADASATRGAKLFNDLACVKCHAITGASEDARVGPDLTHLAGRSTLAAGRFDNTPANLTAWLEDPQMLKPGSHMPSLKLTGAQAADLVTYFGTLK